MHKKSNIYERYIKRMLDIFFSMVLMVLLSPVYLILFILVRMKLGKPAVFVQQRPGKDEKIFNMYKFRTMTDQRDKNGNLCSDEIRLTPFGKKLRSTSLDELPELWNIFKGDMSFVGPRPLLVSYLKRYNDEQKKRHMIRPGITGLAQVNGRNAISWEAKFKYDVQYVEKVSIGADFKILLKTVAVVFKKSGVSSDTSVTMEEFKGKVD